jgi:hypothetical protein
MNWLYDKNHQDKLPLKPVHGMLANSCLPGNKYYYNVPASKQTCETSRYR